MARKAARNGDESKQSRPIEAAGTPKRKVGRPKGGVAMDQPPPPPRSVVEEAVDSIRDAISQIRACTERVRSMLDGDACSKCKRGAYDDRLASHLSWLARNMSANLDAMRKQESAERKRWTGSPADELEVVKVWYEEAPEEQRAEMRSFVVVDSRGVLS